MYITSFLLLKRYLSCFSISWIINSTALNIFVIIFSAKPFWWLFKEYSEVDRAQWPSQSRAWDSPTGKATQGYQSTSRPSLPSHKLASFSTENQCAFPSSVSQTPLQSATGGSGCCSTYSMGNQSPHRCFTVSMSSWQRRRKLTSLRALDGTTSVIHTCREGGSIRRVAKLPHQPSEPTTPHSLPSSPPNL